MRLQVRASRFLVSHGRKQKNLPTNHGCGCVLTSLCSCRLSISLSLSFFLYFSRGPLSSLFNRFCFSLHFIRFTFPSLFAPFSISFYLPLLPMRRYLLSLSSLQHFYHHVIFFSLSLFRCLYPFLFPSRIFPLPYFSSTRLLSLTPIHLLTFSRVLRPTCANAIYTYSLRILSRTLTHSLRFFHVATVFVRLAGLVGFSLRSTTFPPPLSTPYCHLVIVPRIYESSRVERC